MMLDMELKEQRREGYDEGYDQGCHDEHIKTLTENVRTLAEGMRLSHDEALDKLKVSQEDRLAVIEGLNSKVC